MGQTADKRESGGVRLCKNFDNFTKPSTLSPYRSIESAHVLQSTDKIKNFLTYNNKIYGLGITGDAGDGYTKVFESGSITNPSWSGSASGVAASGGPDARLFVEYKGVIYGATGSQYIWTYNIDSPAFNQTARDLTSITHIAQGIVHSKDDILYIPYDNKIAKNNNGSWTNSSLTLPSNLIITAVCEYGNYLAIGCRPVHEYSNNSVVYLWDRDSSLATLSEKIDWGSGNLHILETIDGQLIGVSLVRGLSTFDNSIAPSRIVFSRYNGVGAVDFEELLLSALSTGYNGSSTETARTHNLRHQQKYGNRIYFGVGGTSIGGSTGDFAGVWSVGRNSENDPFSVIFERPVNNNTLIDSVIAFKFINEYLYCSYFLNDGTPGTGNQTYGMSKTNDNTTSFTAMSILETNINPNMDVKDKMKLKKLTAVSLTYEKLPTDAQVVLQYKKDGASSYTTIFTETTNNAVVTEKRVALASGRDYEFRIESTGGAEITGFKYEYDVENSQI